MRKIERERNILAIVISVPTPFVYCVVIFNMSTKLTGPLTCNICWVKYHNLM